MEVLTQLASFGAFLLIVLAIDYFLRTALTPLRMARRVKMIGESIGEAGEDADQGLAQGTASIRSVFGKAAIALGALMPLSEADREKISANLRRAGFESGTGLATMLGIKFASLATGLVVGVIIGTASLPGMLGVFVGLIGGVFAGVILNVIPEMVLGRLATRRMRRINDGMAETFDLLVVSLESGLTFDRSIRRAVQSLSSFHPALAKEFQQVIVDISVHGRTQEEAIDRLAGRVESQVFRDLAIAVGQSSRHGTPLADVLRNLASSLRVEAIARVQEKMARLPTLLVVPSIAFILPGIIVIVGGPAFLKLADSMSAF